MNDETQYIIDDYEHSLPGLFYTPTRIPGKNAPDLLFEQIMRGCACANTLCDDNCSCLLAGPNYTKQNDEYVLMKEKLGDLPVFECNSQCVCVENVESCTNRCVQFGPCKELEIFETAGKGYGLRTNRRIRSGRFVCEYAGEVIDVEEAKNRQAMNASKGSMNYIFILTEHFNNSKIVTCVDPSTIGNIGRYINHSCQPNCAIVPIRVNTMIPLLCIFAVRDIDVGEELSFDYGSGNGGIHGDNLKPCLCSADTCRKWLPFQSV